MRVPDECIHEDDVAFTHEEVEGVLIPALEEIIEEVEEEKFLNDSDDADIQVNAPRAIKQINGKGQRKGIYKAIKQIRDLS